MLIAAEYHGAIWYPSKNFNEGRDKHQIDRVIIHITDGQDRASRAAEHLCKTKADFLEEAALLDTQGKHIEAEKARHRSPVSAHFLIGRTQGEIYQLVSINDTAWQASGINHHSLGIEHVARTPRELGPNDPGLPVTVTQYSDSAALVRFICAKVGLVPSRDTVIPHCKVEGTTHLDCGKDILDGGIWDWGYYMGLLLTTSDHLQEISDSLIIPKVL